MEPWIKISAVLCIFGVLKEFRPSEPYVTKYLSNPPMNFTLEQISSDIYPVAIYSTMISLIFVFLLTDYLCHKPVIIFHIMSGITVYIFFIFGKNLLTIQIAEVFYGLFMSSEIAYYTYIYAKVDKSHYQKVSGYTKAAYLAGRSLAGLTGQVLLLYNISTYFTLNYITLASVAISAAWTFFLPPVSKAESLNKIKRNHSTHVQNEEMGRVNIWQPTEGSNAFLASLKCMKEDFCDTFLNFHAAKWVLWYALASCGYYQVLTYIQVLWEEISSGTDAAYISELNGLVETIFTLLSATVCYGVGYFKADWDKFGETILCISPLLSSIMLFSMAVTDHILFAYGTFILYTMIYHAMSTITNSEMAKAVNEERHGLIFGFASLLGFIFQSILMSIVNSYLSLSARKQFLIYGFYFGLLGGAFGAIVLIKISKHCLMKR